MMGLKSHRERDRTDTVVDVSIWGTHRRRGVTPINVLDRLSGPSKLSDYLLVGEFCKSLKDRTMNNHI